MIDSKRLVFWLLAVLLAVSGLQACSGTAGHSAGPVSVAVLDFEDLSPIGHGQDGMGELLAAQIAARLDETGTYRVVERSELLRIMEELHVGSSQLTDDDTRLRLGRIIGAGEMVFGAFQVIGRTMRLDIRCVDVTSGKILKTAQSMAAADRVSTWLDAADQAAAELLNP